MGSWPLASAVVYSGWIGLCIMGFSTASHGSPEVSLLSEAPPLLGSYQMFFLCTKEACLIRQTQFRWFLAIGQQLVAESRAVDSLYSDFS